MSAHYRFSIIPAGAITDERLTPRALQVLCLLGRHTNDNGWCSRSQVKMAREIRCSRAALYEAIQLLLETGWIERKRNGRGGTGPEASEHPFAAYSYRVVLDRDDLPARLQPDADDADTTAADVRGVHGAPAAPTEGPKGGAAIAAGGAAPEAAPLERSPCKGIPAEPSERECARAREHERLAKLKAAWPTAALDDQARILRAWEALGESERDAALAGVETFLAALRRHKRGHTPTLWRYLEERRWTLLPEERAARVDSIQCWSKEWWAALLARIDRGQPVAWMVQFAAERGGAWAVAPDELPPPEAMAVFKSYPSDGPELAAWRPWLAVRGAKLPQWRERIWVFLPGPEPPHGQPALRAGSEPQAA